MAENRQPNQAGEGLRGAQEKPADAGELLQIWRANQEKADKELRVRQATSRLLIFNYQENSMVETEAMAEELSKYEQFMREGAAKLELLSGEDASMRHALEAELRAIDQKLEVTSKDLRACVDLRRRVVAISAGQAPQAEAARTKAAEQRSAGCEATARGACSGAGEPGDLPIPLAQLVVQAQKERVLEIRIQCLKDKKRQLKAAIKERDTAIQELKDSKAQEVERLCKGLEQSELTRKELARQLVERGRDMREQARRHAAQLEGCEQGYAAQLEALSSQQQAELERRVQELERDLVQQRATALKQLREARGEAEDSEALFMMALKNHLEDMEVHTVKELQLRDHAAFVEKANNRLAAEVDGLRSRLVVLRCPGCRQRWRGRSRRRRPSWRPAGLSTTGWRWSTPMSWQRHSRRTPKSWRLCRARGTRTCTCWLLPL